MAPFKNFAKLTRELDIMISLLRNTTWYERKSALRAGIGMALGIPVVASPVGEQKVVIKHGVSGFSTRNEEELYRCLKVLIEDEKLWHSIEKSGRQKAEQKTSLHVCGKKLFACAHVINGLFK